LKKYAKKTNFDYALKLKTNKLYTNGENGEFTMIEIEFSKHVVTSLDIKSNDKKIEVIVKLNQPTISKDIKFLYELKNYHKNSL